MCEKALKIRDYRVQEVTLQPSFEVTPKRKAVGSIPIGRAKKQRRGGASSLFFVWLKKRTAKTRSNMFHVKQLLKNAHKNNGFVNLFRFTNPFFYGKLIYIMVYKGDFASKTPHIG